jgi:hypothetical protein
MTQTEALVYMLQLASDCNHAKKDFVTCRNEALIAKPELWKHYGFLHGEFENYYSWTSRILDPEEVERIQAYYNQLAQVK